VDETAAKEGKAMSRLDKLTERMKAAVGAELGVGRTLKFSANEKHVKPEGKSSDF
jgi:hypothetical protein